VNRFDLQVIDLSGNHPETSRDLRFRLVDRERRVDVILPRGATAVDIFSHLLREGAFEVGQIVTSLELATPEPAVESESGTVITIPLPGGRAEVSLIGPFPIARTDWDYVISVLDAMSPGLVLS